MEIAEEVGQEPETIGDGRKRQWKLIDEEGDQGMVGVVKKKLKDQMGGPRF